MPVLPRVCNVWVYPTRIGRQETFLKADHTITLPAKSACLSFAVHTVLRIAVAERRLMLDWPEIYWINRTRIFDSTPRCRSQSMEVVGWEGH